MEVLGDLTPGFGREFYESVVDAKLGARDALLGGRSLREGPAGGNFLKG